MDATNDLELAALKAIILYARHWACEHFNHANWRTATLLDEPSFRVTFPDVDTMHVEPYCFGQPMHTGVMDYRLRIPKQGAITWHPMYKMLGVRQLPELVLPAPTPEQYQALVQETINVATGNEDGD
jgi:hypothetical protein